MIPGYIGHRKHAASAAIVCHFLAQTSHANLTETEWEYPPTEIWNANIEAARLSLAELFRSLQSLQLSEAMPLVLRLLMVLVAGF